MTYKEEHEAFVSGLSGSPWWMVLYIGLSIALINGIRQKLDLGRAGNWKTSGLLDFLFLLLPLLLLLSYPTTLAVWMNGFFLTLFILLHFMQKKTASDKTTQQNALKLPYLSAYRSCLLLLTCLAILAVDFHIFPRYFAKTETYGYSLVRGNENDKTSSLMLL